MRKAGQGSVTRIASGYWVRMWIDGKRASLGVYPTAGEAEEVRRAVRRKLAAKGRATAGGVTLRAFGERVFDEREADGVRDVEGERSRWRNHVEPEAFIDLPIAGIAAPVIDAWARELQQKMTATPGHEPHKISRKTVRGVVRLVSLVFRRALALGLVTSNPCAAVRVRDEVVTHEPWTYLLPEEQTALLTCEDVPEVDRVIIAFGLGTGLRQGEQFGLRLVDVRVDGERPEIVVRRGSKLKGPKSNRIKSIPLFGLGLAAARRWLELLPAYTRDAKGKSHNELGLMFPGRRGGHRGRGKHLHASRTVGGKAVKVDLFREALAKAGIRATRRHDGRLPRWHDLRHTCASSLVAGWWGRPWSLEEVCAYLRHSSIVVTQRYAHLGQTALRNAAGGTPDDLSWLRTGYEAGASINEKPLNHRVGRQGLEPWTYGLKGPSKTLQNQQVETPRNLAITSLQALAAKDAAAARAAGRALAAAVLAELPYTAARAVLEGGPHLDTRIAELAAAVLDDAGNERLRRAR